jgi:hypothetical protein
MDTIRNRAKDRFPMVLLTLLSIVQALALEFLWDHMRHRTEIFEISGDALLAWLQFAASLNVLILIWLMYAGMLMRFRWTPTITDSIWPFFIGLIQFLMIEIMGAEKLALWIIVLALIYGTTDFINHRAMKRARTDPANREFFDRYLPATLRDFAPQITMVTTLILAGGWIWISEHHGWFAICTLVGCLIGLGYETHKAARYWNISMGNG